MPTSIETVRARVASQKALLPALYGQVDFDRTPERWTDDASVALVKERSPMGISPSQHDLDLVRAYTMLGDIVADAYAALLPRYGPGRLVKMLQQACEQGVEKVADAPPELAAFIRDMERIPDWVDLDLVREGARLDLNATANVAPFAIRGAFIATFLNKYSALPMALTGTLSNQTAAHRVRETAHFFACTVLPGALDRHGAGFKAAAMVRLMHSMVRVNVLSTGKWDPEVYGVPIPQVDQMPAGLIPVFLLAFRMLREGRRPSTARALRTSATTSGISVGRGRSANRTRTSRRAARTARSTSSATDVLRPEPMLTTSQPPCRHPIARANASTTSSTWTKSRRGAASASRISPLRMPARLVGTSRSPRGPDP